MTRKDYTLIAGSIATAIRHEREDKDLSGIGALEAFARGLAWVLADENEYFDRDRFLAAAGVA